jgi:DNA-directed RNA polymerase subunit RPC12/RpoP
MYRCGKCGAPVTVIGTVKIRVCPHLDAPIIAEMRVNLEGRGGLR